ncbi:hypothetical protein GJ654_18810 [Rhodoblastus acidophilus]|uniref:Uncharacterized protein n=1 Tax=Rhodoblastus acidophilus TaxID=1074 RepID=A0A6N8DTZ1_RHOAC|nr:hypothetical protein [Rhodoblastus acidophilus]MCW2276380.1 hypothetical protein [Rhodoblastus acidophilus]MTV33035.1 hypothetical protein [Rhodoblastus acidophilus]
MAYGVGKVITAGQKAQHERLRMEASGMAKEEIEHANAQALKLAKDIPNFDQSTTMHMLRNMRSIVGSYEEAAELLEPMMKLRAVTEAARGGENMAEEFDKLIKGMEIKGATQNPREFRQYMDGMAKAMNVFGDTLRPTDYYEMFKYGRQSTRGLSQEYMLQVAPTLAQELGGAQAGTAQQAFFSAIVGGKMTKTALKQMMDYGLVDPSKVYTPKGGHIAQVKPGGIIGSQMAMANPYEWVNQFLLPALAKKGVVDPNKIQEVIATLFSKGTAAQLVSIFATQQSRFMKDAALVRGAKGLESADMFNSRDGGIAFRNLGQQLGSYMQEAGKAIADSLAAPTNEFAQAVASATERLHENLEANKKGEVSPGQERFNDLANKVVGDLTRDPNNKAAYAKRRDELFGRLEKLNKDLKFAEGMVNQTGGAQAWKDQVAQINAAREAIAAEAGSMIEAHEALARLRADADGAAQALESLKQYAMNREKPELKPGDRHPGGPAAFPLSKDYSGLDANGAPKTEASKQSEHKPLDLQAILNGKIEAVVNKPVDVTGKVELEGSAQVTVGIRVLEGAGRVDSMFASSKGHIKANVKASTGPTMPNAGAPQ